MNGTLLPTVRHLLSQGHQLIKPGQPVQVHGIQASFESAARDVQAVVGPNADQFTLNIHVFVGGANVVASIADLGKARVGVAWVRMMRRQSSSGDSQANLGVIIGRQSPAQEPGYDLLALVKLEDTTRREMSGSTGREECGNEEETEAGEEDQVHVDFDIQVQFVNGKSCTLPAHARSTVDDLKRMIIERFGYRHQPQQIRLVFGVQELQNGQFLSSYRIGDGAVLHSITRLRGG